MTARALIETVACCVIGGIGAGLGYWLALVVYQ